VQVPGAAEGEEGLEVDVEDGVDWGDMWVATC
jgi:hypothetical protein